MRVFIIRPFRVKEAVDFDRVERELIRPALQGLKEDGIEISGGTTGEISRQGNIREDMFRLIVVSDLVIADVSIHNANVFYELGIRHALRTGHTFLMRSDVPKQDYPFDLQTDRYFLYNSADLKQRVTEMTQALRSTLAADPRDSPIFLLLPKLRPHGRGELIAVPTSFQEDVTLALRNGRLGDLRLLASEAVGFEWDQEGLRLVGDAQFKLRAFAGARDTFESLRQSAPEDLHTNLRLGTIYQRLTLGALAAKKEEYLAKSELALERAEALTNKPDEKAERYALLGSNAKSRWIDEFRAAGPEERESRALRSAYLPKMLGFYLQAANQDLNAHYPAVNALALLKVQMALARRYPEIWKGACGEAQAEAELQAREMLATRLVASLHLALQMDEIVGRREGPPDPWAVSSRADLILLTASGDKEKVAHEYRQAVTGADRFTLEANRRNLAIFQELKLFEPGVSAALGVIDEMMAATQARPIPSHVVLFSGHRVDPPGRPVEKRRFPPTAEAEQKARELIKEAVSKEISGHEGTTVGIAGGACGGDILFHEVCAELRIATEVFLGLPANEYQKESVERGGPGWVGRFQDLCEQRPVHILQETRALPRWLTDKPQYDVWQRNNLWMMFNALATKAPRRVFVALFNAEREPEGAGGTQHLVEEVVSRGFKSVCLDARALLT